MPQPPNRFTRLILIWLSGVAVKHKHIESTSRHEWYLLCMCVCAVNTHRVCLFVIHPKVSCCFILCLFVAASVNGQWHGIWMSESAVAAAKGEAKCGGMMAWIWWRLMTFVGERFCFVDKNRIADCDGVCAHKGQSTWCRMWWTYLLLLPWLRPLLNVFVYIRKSIRKANSRHGARTISTFDSGMGFRHLRAQECRSD